jgi:quercetin dioxygenase-like cupin family protein
MKTDEHELDKSVLIPCSSVFICGFIRLVWRKAMTGADKTKDWIQLAPGVRRKTAAVGESMMQVIVWFEKGAKVPEHAHVHEQIATVISGKMRFTVAGQTRDVPGGDSVMLKSNVPHSAEALEESWILDTFSPLRQDMLKVDAEHAAKRPA